MPTGSPIMLCIAALLLTAVTGIHVAVVSIPAYGHFMPVKAIAEALLLRGHRVTLFVETEEWCSSSFHNASYQCILMPPSGTFQRELLSHLSELENLQDSFTALFNELLVHNREQLGNYLDAFGKEHARTPFELILMDVSTLVGFSLSKKFLIPHVSVFPLAMHLVVGPATYLPSLGTGFPRRMTFLQRLHNFLMKMVVSVVAHSLVTEMNQAHAQHDIPLMEGAYELAGLDGLIFAPTIWGYDIPQPLCPNIVALGAFSPSVQHMPIEPDLQVFLDRCHHGAIYVNFGTLAVVGDSMFARVQEALLQSPYCVVWKVVEEKRRQMLPALDRFYISKRFENPIEIMKHPNTRVFLTHCGDTSLMEAVQAEVPLAGIPFFADQGDVCLRLNESGIGRYVGHKHHFTSLELVTVLHDVAESNSYRERIKILNHISKSHGGAARAADMIESRFADGLLGGEGFLEECAHLTDELGRAPALSVQEYDFLLLHLGFVMVMCYIALTLVRWCCRTRSVTSPDSPHIRVVKRKQ